MQFILLALVLFVVCCGLYGIYVGIAATVRVIARFSGSLHHGHAARETRARPKATDRWLAQCQESPEKNSAKGEIHADLNAIDTCLDELQRLNFLLQNGALSQEEFVQFKRQVLGTLTRSDHIKEAI